MIAISVYHETCLSVFYATVFYFIFYLRSTSSKIIFNSEKLQYMVEKTYLKAKSMQLDEGSVVCEVNED